MLGRWSVVIAALVSILAAIVSVWSSCRSETAGSAPNVQVERANQTNEGFFEFNLFTEGDDVVLKGTIVLRNRGRAPTQIVNIRLEILPSGGEVPEKPWVAVSDVGDPHLDPDHFYKLRANPVLGLTEPTVKAGERKTLWFVLNGRGAAFEDVLKTDPPAPPRLRITLTLASGAELTVLPAVKTGLSNGP